MTNTSAPISEVAIGNMAVDILDDRPITSLDDNTSAARFLSREFGYARDEVLRMFPWPCAKARAAISPDGDTPAFGWKYQYTAPTDCLRLLALRDCQGTWNTSAPLKYEYESRKILCNVSSILYVNYIKRLTNVSLFDPEVARVLGCYLAVLGAQRITGKAGYFDKASALLKSALDQGRLISSLEMGPQEDVLGMSNAVLDARGAPLWSIN